MSTRRFLFIFFTALALMRPWVSDKSTALMTLTANVICFGPWSGSLYIQLSNYKVVHVWSENAVITSERGAFNWTEVINSQLCFTQEETSMPVRGVFITWEECVLFKWHFPHCERWQKGFWSLTRKWLRSAQWCAQKSPTLGNNQRQQSAWTFQAAI